MNALASTGKPTRIDDRDKAAEQIEIEHALITHSHLDHTVGLAFLTDTLAMVAPDRRVTVASISPVVRSLQSHAFNDALWPDFTNIPSGAAPVLGFRTLAEGKEAREFDGRMYIMERALQADFALVKAWKGDRWGNLVYRKTARNFNPMMATAARVTIAEVEHLVEVGDLAPDSIHTPSVYVKRIFQGESYERRIERRTVRKAQ